MNLLWRPQAFTFQTFTMDEAFALLSDFSVTDNLTVFLTMVILVSLNLVTVVWLGLYRGHRNHINRIRSNKLSEDEAFELELSQLRAKQRRVAKSTFQADLNGRAPPPPPPPLGGGEGVEDVPLAKAILLPASDRTAVSGVQVVTVPETALRGGTPLRPRAWRAPFSSPQVAPPLVSPPSSPPGVRATLEGDGDSDDGDEAAGKKKKSRGRRSQTVKSKKDMLADLREARKQLHEANSPAGAEGAEGASLSSLCSRFYACLLAARGFAGRYVDGLRSEHTFVSFIAPTEDEEGLTRAQAVQCVKRILTRAPSRFSSLGPCVHRRYSLLRGARSSPILAGCSSPRSISSSPCSACSTLPPTLARRALGAAAASEAAVAAVRRRRQGRRCSL